MKTLSLLLLLIAVPAFAQMSMLATHENPFPVCDEDEIKIEALVMDVVRMDIVAHDGTKRELGRVIRPEWMKFPRSSEERIRPMEPRPG